MDFVNENDAGKTLFCFSVISIHNFKLKSVSKIFCFWKMPFMERCGVLCKKINIFVLVSCDTILNVIFKKNNKRPKIRKYEKNCLYTIKLVVTGLKQVQIWFSLQNNLLTGWFFFKLHLTGCSKPERKAEVSLNTLYAESCSIENTGTVFEGIFGCFLYSSFCAYCKNVITWILDIPSFCGDYSVYLSLKKYILALICFVLMDFAVHQHSIGHSAPKT